MEIVIIVLLLASLFGVWLLSVRRKLETQEENIRNAMYQTLVQLSAEREALEGLAEFLGQTMDAETFRRMKHSLESAQTAGEAGLPEWVAEQQRELLRVQKKIAEILAPHVDGLEKDEILDMLAFAGTGDLSEVLESSKKL